MMKIISVFIVTIFILSGCAVPMPVQVASWALDGISLLATNKSVTDHGISIIAQKDCAMWRGLTKGELCKDLINDNIMLANKGSGTEDIYGSLENPTKNPAQISLSSNEVPYTPDIIEDHSSKENVTPLSNQVNSNLSLVTKPHISELTSKVMSVDNFSELQNRNSTNGSYETANGLTAKPNEMQSYLKKGKYLVVGSFQKASNAILLTEVHKEFPLKIIGVRLKNKNVFRVVYGPLKSGLELKVLKSIRRAGFENSWPIWVKGDDRLLGNYYYGKSIFSEMELAFLLH